MKSYYITDESFVNTEEYRKFRENNPVYGTLRVRAYAASQAIPISGVKVVVSSVVGNSNVIFFEGFTNESGVIDGISLPAPRLNGDNLYVPNKITYDVKATYFPDNINLVYKVNIYENVFVIQNINIVPEMKRQVGGF